jgi:hypothetical protein
MFLRVGGERFCTLPAKCNWVVPLALPLWDGGRREFVMATAPFEALGVMHLCHPGLHEPQEVVCVGGGAKPRGYRRKHMTEALGLGGKRGM